MTCAEITGCAPSARTRGASGSVRGTDQGISEGAVPMGEGAQAAGTCSGRNYVVVSADTHASPDSLDHFLSYVDPARPRGGGGLRRHVRRWPSPCSAASTRARSTNPTRCEPRPPGAWPAWASTSTRPQGWLAHYGTDWVVPGDGDGRRLAVLEEQGIHAEVTLPGPILAGGLSPAMYLGGHSDKGLEVVWPALHGYVRWLADFCAAAPGRRAGCMPIDFHDMDRAVDEVAWARQHGIFGGRDAAGHVGDARGCPGYADEYYEPFWSACEDHQMVVNLHTGASGSATDTKFLYDPSTAACSASTRSSSSPGGRSGS